MSTYRTTTIRDFIDDILLGSSAIRVIEKLPELTKKIPPVDLAKSSVPELQYISKATGIADPTKFVNGVAHAANGIMQVYIADAAANKLMNIKPVKSLAGADAFVSANTVGRIPVIGPAIMEAGARENDLIADIADFLHLRGISKIAREKERQLRKKAF